MEAISLEKHEYFNGEVVAMAGNTLNHNRIVNNLIGELHNFLKGKDCESYPSDFRVATPLFESYMYPDVTNVCGETEMKDDHFDTLTNPVVVIEVMTKQPSKMTGAINIFIICKYLLCRNISSLIQIAIVLKSLKFKKTLVVR